MNQIENDRPGKRASTGFEAEGFDTRARSPHRHAARAGGGLRSGQEMTVAAAIVEHVVEEIENRLRGIGKC